jgi:uncharacterized protein involved in type VI secretion and phage assembly
MSQDTLRRFYGKYRGIVTNIEDEKKLGRIRAKVPAVFGDKETGWALPSVPYAGKGVGFYFIPPIHACVWIEFEDGMTDRPIYSGCFWDEKEVPAPANPAVKMIKTNFATITLDDKKNEIVIQTNSSTTTTKIVMHDGEIELITGQSHVKMTADDSTVSVDDGALTINKV